jgi:hypothetical protein
MRLKRVPAPSYADRAMARIEDAILDRWSVAVPDDLREPRLRGR